MCLQVQYSVILSGGRSPQRRIPRLRVTDRRHLHHPSCLPFEGRWQRRQALTERSCQVSCPPLGREEPPLFCHPERSEGSRACAFVFALKGATSVPAHRGRERGLRLAKSRRCAAVARWTPAAAGVRGRTAHYDSLRAAAARRLLACTLAAAREEGRHLRFLPSCESPHFPSGRAARVKTEFRLAVATRLPAEHGGEWVPPQNGCSAYT